MPIRFSEEAKTFTLLTEHTAYQMKVADYGCLLHLYYGDRVEDDDLSWLIVPKAIGFAPALGDAGDRREFSLDVLPQEYPTVGAGDFRESCLTVRWPDGSRAVDLRYVSHRIEKGKPSLAGLPAVYASKEECETLQITLKDKMADLEVTLCYSVLPELDVITRSVRILNRTGAPLVMERALSCCVDFPVPRPMELISFWGGHAYERMMERTPLRHGKLRIDSARGASSHQQNPFAILCEQGTTEEAGGCYGFSFVYSGNFLAQAELDQLGQTRFVMGLSPEGFSWTLADGESFTTPEVAFSYSPDGLAQLSHHLHRLLRQHVCRGKYRDVRRPILINNWEATYFQFNREKLLAIAREAAGLGVEMLVVDDGWFGKRDSDTSGLGDWTVNTQKLEGGLAPLCEEVNRLGMKLGIWFEPEMVSEDSELYRAHPDWCLHIPGRRPLLGRCQLVLDISRPEVRDYLFHAISAVLNSARIEYVKWDMNRHLTDVWSAQLPPERQGELSHRHILGVYELLERLTSAFPEVLFEGCSGGGGRFDAGMLYYTPQIWCSDNTDAVERLDIQYGTSFGYPVSAVGAHVSACPNHQTGRSVSFHTRGIVAMSGTFGYELDPAKLCAEEKAQIKEQTAFFKRHANLIANGDYYRLSDPLANREYAAWMIASSDAGEALVSYVLLRTRPYSPQPVLRLKGLDPQKHYSVDGKGAYSGRALMKAGLVMPQLSNDYEAVFLLIAQIGE